MENHTLDRLANFFLESGPVAVLTGAGISTESGIPDFRSPGTGLYNRMNPMEYLSVKGMMAQPGRFWRGFSEIVAVALGARPNRGHLALARLEQAGHISTLITQNIDGLHQKAGSRNVIELHGHLQTARCTRCETRLPMVDALGRFPARPIPLCEVCGKMLRPDVVLFGDIPTEYDRALRAVQEAGSLLIVGSSLSVSPANFLVYEADRVAIINRDATLADEAAEILASGAAGDVLNNLASRLLDGKE
ncbi:NAD-dependent deacylase [bacterium]|nr:NAD-dependent deacylase [bacterium]